MQSDARGVALGLGLELEQLRREYSALSKRAQQMQVLLLQAPAAAQTEMGWEDWWSDVVDLLGGGVTAVRKFPMWRKRGKNYVHTPDRSEKRRTERFSGDFVKMDGTHSDAYERSDAYCAECDGPVHFVQFDFVVGEQKVEPCGHHASIVLKVRGSNGR
jgi:hypothetical protein